MEYKQVWYFIYYIKQFSMFLFNATKNDKFKQNKIYKYLLENMYKRSIVNLEILKSFST